MRTLRHVWSAWPFAAPIAWIALPCAHIHVKCYLSTQVRYQQPWQTHAFSFSDCPISFQRFYRRFLAWRPLPRELNFRHSLCRCSVAIKLTTREKFCDLSNSPCSRCTQVCAKEGDWLKRGYKIIIALIFWVGHFMYKKTFCFKLLLI